MTIRRTLVAAVLSGGLLLTAGCAGDDVADDDADNDDGSGGGGNVTLASQSFDEAALVTAMYDALLDDAGYEVETKLVDTRAGLPRRVPRRRSTSSPSTSPASATSSTSTPTARTPRRSAPATSTRRWPRCSRCSTRRASPCSSRPRRSVAERLLRHPGVLRRPNGVTALSDLEGESITLAAAPDCEGRDDCEAGPDRRLRHRHRAARRSATPRRRPTQSVIDGEAQLGQTGTLDGTLDDQGLVLLEDDRGIQPAQNLVPAVSTEFLDEHHDVEEPLNDADGARSTTTPSAS